MKWEQVLIVHKDNCLSQVYKSTKIEILRIVESIYAMWNKTNISKNKTKKTFNQIFFSISLCYLRYFPVSDQKGQPFIPGKIKTKKAAEPPRSAIALPMLGTRRASANDRKNRKMASIMPRLRSFIRLYLLFFDSIPSSTVLNKTVRIQGCTVLIMYKSTRNEKTYLSLTGKYY